jgi:hypothetical protein
VDVLRKVSLASDPTANLAQSLNAEPEAILDIFIGERGRIPSVNSLFKDFGEKLPYRCRVTHHVSLDAAVISIFVGD